MADDGRWLVLGLGNPDGEYGGTRHNVGASAVTLLADDLGARLRRHKTGAWLADTFTPARRVPLTLGRPGGYMNNSGGPTQAALAFYSLPLERLIVVHDELDLPFGAVRLKQGGGAGGHNGLRDIQQRCGGPGFLRVRVGVGRPPGRMDPAAYVLQRFPAGDREDVRLICDRTGEAVVDLVEDGLERAQNRHHAG